VVGDPVFNVDFRADSRRLALGHRDGAISVFELATGQRLYRLKPSKIRREVGIALHPTEPTIAVLSYFDHCLQLRDLRTGDVQREVDRMWGFVHSAWSPDGRTLAVGGGDDGRLFFYDRQLNLLRELQTRTGGVKVAFNHLGDRLVSIGWGGTVQLWDVVTGQLLFTLPGSIVAPTLHRFSKDDQWLAGTISGNQLGFWKVGAGREVRTLVRAGLPGDVHYFSAAVSTKQPQLLAVGMGDGVGLWNLDSGAQLHFLKRRGGVMQVIFEPSGTLLTLEEDSGVYRWEVPPDFAKPQLCFDPPQKLPFPRGGRAMSQSRDGRVLAMSVRNTLVTKRWAGTWVLHAGQPERPICLDPQADAAHVAVSRDGRWVATALHLNDTLKIWEARSGRLVRELKQGGGTAFAQFSPDGKWLATGLDSNRVWAVNREPWTEGPRLRPGVGLYPDFSPDSTFIAHTTSTGAVGLVDVGSGRELAQLAHPHLDSAHLAFTPDGTRLIMLTNGTVRGIHIWDLRSIRKELARMGLDWN